MADSLTVSLAQTEGAVEPGDNLEKARRFSARAARVGADMVVFPEMFMALPKADVALDNIAQPLDGSFVQALKEIARSTGLYLCAGLWERSPQPPRVYNTAVVLGPSGKMVARYRKLHLFDALAVKESERMLAGAALPPVFEIKGFRVGLGICYDLRFPEFFRYLSRQEMDLAVVPAAWYAGPMKTEMWLTLLRARAMENVCYVAGAVLTGKHFTGHSAAFDPFGVPLADAGVTEGLATFTVEPERINQVRQKLPALSHRRLDILG